MWAKEGEDLSTTCKNCGVAVLPPDDYCKSCADKKLTGIGGWLYLPAISLVLVIISSIYSFIQTWGLVQGNQEEPLRTLLYLEVVVFAMVFLLVSYTTFFVFLKRNASSRTTILPFFCRSSYLILLIFGEQYSFFMPQLIFQTHGAC
ncbi:DUF2569 family protein [Escherichia sp. E4208]|uniref:DUF2569 family protein n=1 Tax=Escherichia sp. E4208 TaxID=2044463 RepID=UPI001F10D1C2|nr:DUF2569 family protein [Escherichia sp. E4208]